jgi:hypothetical protein
MGFPLVAFKNWKLKLVDCPVEKQLIHPRRRVEQDVLLSTGTGSFICRIPGPFLFNERIERGYVSDPKIVFDWRRRKQNAPQIAETGAIIRSSANKKN